MTVSDLRTAVLHRRPAQHMDPRPLTLSSRPFPRPGKEDGGRREDLLD